MPSTVSRKISRNLRLSLNVIQICARKSCVVSCNQRATSLRGHVLNHFEHVLLLTAQPIACRVRTKQGEQGQLLWVQPGASRFDCRGHEWTCVCTPVKLPLPLMR
jgi:hypothetical protein